MQNVQAYLKMIIRTFKEQPLRNTRCSFKNKRLTFSPNMAVFILDGCPRVGQHLFISGVLIGYYLLNLR